MLLQQSLEWVSRVILVLSYVSVVTARRGYGTSYTLSVSFHLQPKSSHGRPMVELNSRSGWRNTRLDCTSRASVVEDGDVNTEVTPKRPEGPITAHCSTHGGRLDDHLTTWMLLRCPGGCKGYVEVCMREGDTALAATAGVSNAVALYAHMKFGAGCTMFWVHTQSDFDVLEFDDGAFTEVTTAGVRGITQLTGSGSGTGGGRRRLSIDGIILAASEPVTQFSIMTAGDAPSVVASDAADEATATAETTGQEIEIVMSEPVAAVRVLGLDFGEVTSIGAPDAASPVTVTMEEIATSIASAGASSDGSTISSGGTSLASSETEEATVLSDITEASDIVATVGEAVEVVGIVIAI